MTVPLALHRAQIDAIIRDIAEGSTIKYAVLSNGMCARYILRLYRAWREPFARR
jgi:hypothetical protein